MRNTVNRPSGSWSIKQEEDLQDLIRNNIVDYRNRNPDYLFQITEEHFPAYITPGATWEERRNPTHAGGIHQVRNRLRAQRG